MSRPLNVIYAILLIVSFSCAFSTANKNYIKGIVEVLQSFHKPTNVIANVCWKHSSNKKLMADLAYSKNPTSIKFDNEIHVKDLARAEQIIFLVDVSCKGVQEYINSAASNKYFGRPYRWFVIDRLNSETDVPLELDDKNLLPDSEVYVMQFKNNSYNINLIYKIKPNGDWKIENYGKWSADGLVLSREATEMAIAMRRRNLARETIITSIIILDNSSLADLEIMRYKYIDSLAKIGYNVLKPLYDFINAKRELILANAWGYKVNGTWTGMLGDLSQGRAELGGVVTFITKERMMIVEFLSHPSDSTVKFLFRQPPLSYQNNLYLLPFEASVWYCIGSFILVLVVIIYINAYWEAKKDVEKADDTSVLIPSVSDIAVFVISAISQQGSNVELKGTLGRSVIFLLFLVFLFLYTAYSASIVVLLQSTSNQIRTLSDLLHSKLELGVQDTVYNRYYFENAKDPIRRAIYEKKVAPSGSKPKYLDMADGMRQLQKKPFAFNCNLGLAYQYIERYFHEHEKCGLQEIQYIQDITPWLACRRGSPYREIFKLGLLRNAEHGLNDRANHFIYSKKPVCAVRGGSFVSVSLVDFYPILLMLLYGMILSVVLLLAEILHHRKTSGS